MASTGDHKEPPLEKHGLHLDFVNKSVSALSTKRIYAKKNKNFWLVVNVNVGAKPKGPEISNNISLNILI